MLALQRQAGNRAVAGMLSRKPVPKPDDIAAKLAAAKDPLDYDALPDLWWWGVGPNLDHVPDEQEIRKILLDAGRINPKLLAEAKATIVTEGKADRYYSFRHPRHGVIVRARVGRRLGVSKTSHGGPARPHDLGVFTFGRQPAGEGSEPLGAGESGSTEDMLKAVPGEIRQALGGQKRFERLEKTDPEGLLRIAEKLAGLTPDELKLWRSLDWYHTDDVSLIEKSLDTFLAYRDRVRPGTGTHKGEVKPGDPKKKQTEDESLEGQLKKTWKGFDRGKWRGMSHRQRDRTARDIRWEQTKTRLKYMAKHPGETAKDMVKGVVRVDELGKGVWKDIKEAASGDNNAYRRWAGGVGAAGKVSGWVAAVAGILFLALLLIPGVNVAVLATTALVAGATAIVLSEVESELRLRSAVEEDDPDKARQDIEASSAAHANFFLGAAAMAFGFALKIIAKTPIPGRYKNVGDALKAARSEISRITGVGKAFETARANLLAKLKAARSGLPELLKGKGDPYAQLAGKIEAMDPQEFVNRLAKEDPALAELHGADANGQKLSDVAKQIEELQQTGAGMDLPTKFKAQVVEGLKGASNEAASEVSRYAGDLDSTIAAVEKAQDPAALKRALDAAEGKTSPDALAADADAQVRRIAQELAEREDAARQRQIDIIESTKGEPKQPPKPASKPKVKKQPKPQGRQTINDPSKAKQTGEPAPDKSKPATRDDPTPAKVDPQPAKPTPTQQFEQRIADLQAQRAALVNGSGSGSQRVKSRAQLQADELSARKAAAAKKRQLDATRDPNKRDALKKEHEELVDKHADAEAEVLTRREEIAKVDLEIKKARHPLKRTDVDTAWSGKKAEPPRDLPGRQIGKTLNQEMQLWDDVQWAQKRGAKDIRVNEFQVDIDGNYQGINRPDLQYTLDGKRFYVEYEQLSNPRGRPHAERAIANDPKGTVIVKLVPTGPNFKPGQGVKLATYTLDEIVSGAP